MDLEAYPTLKAPSLYDLHIQYCKQNIYKTT